MGSRERVVLEVAPDALYVRDGPKGRRLVMTVVSKGPFGRPFLKWAGGKQWLAWAASALQPRRWSKYYEPFLGGGAFFFSLGAAGGILSDTNRELITTYEAMRSDVESVIKKLRTYPYDASFYEDMRRRVPRSQSGLAARFVYLNKTAFNGLYRVNRKGEFNVPFGRFKNPGICREDRLREASRMLREARLVCADFEKAAASASADDFVYFDPPYITGHLNNGFCRYNARLFSWEDQQRLARLACVLRDRGVHVMVTNADHHELTKLYRGFFYYSLTRHSLIGSPDTRGRVREALLTSYPVAGVPSERV